MHEARSKDELYRKIYHEPEGSIGVLRVELMYSLFIFFNRMKISEESLIANKSNSLIERRLRYMNILSRISYWKLHMISTRIELRSTLNVLGIVSDQKADEKNKEDVFKVIDLSRNLNKKDRRRLSKYAYRAKNRV